MSEQELRELLVALEKNQAKHGATRAKARRYLLKHGFITKTGRLTKRYSKTSTSLRAA
jgi:hypothetical protein